MDYHAFVLEDSSLQNLLLDGRHILEVIQLQALHQVRVDGCLFHLLEELVETLSTLKQRKPLVVVARRLEILEGLSFLRREERAPQKTSGFEH